MGYGLLAGRGIRGRLVMMTGGRGRHCVVLFVVLYEGRLGVFRVVFGVFRAVCRVVPHDGALRRHCVVLRVRHCGFPRAML